MADTKVFSFPENGGSGGGSDLATLLALSNGNSGGLFGGNGGWGGGLIGFFLGLLCGNNGLFGNGLFGGGGNGNGAGFLANLMNNDNGRDLLMQAITAQGEQSRQATQTLSTMLGQDFNLVNTSIQTISTALNGIANAQGTNALQIINAIQAGNASLAAQLCQCCCENRAAIADQTATLQAALNSGFTFSNPDLKMSVMCIGEATSDEQWWDTLVHEIKHVQSHICSFYGVPEKSEEASYLIGYIMRLAIRSLKRD